MKLYRVSKHCNSTYNHLYIEIIGKAMYSITEIFNITWQQNKNEYKYYAIKINFNGLDEVDLFQKLYRQLKNKLDIQYFTQPYEIIEALEKLGYKQCEYYDDIGYTDCEKVKNPNNNVYQLRICGENYSTKLLNKKTYKKQFHKMYKLEDKKDISIKILTNVNNTVKSTKIFDINSLKEENILYNGSDEEKIKILRKRKLEKILNE